VPAFKPFSVNDEWAFKAVDQNVKIYTDGLRIRIKAMEIGTVRDCHETLEGPGRFDIQGPKITPMPTVASFFGFYKVRASEFSRRFGTEFMDVITIGTYRFLSAYFENGRDISNQTPSSLQGFLPKVEQVIFGWTCFFTDLGEFGLALPTLLKYDILVSISGRKVLIALRSSSVASSSETDTHPMDHLQTRVQHPRQ
jgi:hypothetical protein